MSKGMTPELRTSYYARWRPEHGVAVRTSVGTPRGWTGPLEHIRRITPYGAFGHDDWRERYEARLDRIDAAELAQRFADVSTRHDGRPLVLLCFEKDPADCHRSVLAAWLAEHGLGPVREVGP